MMVFTFSRRFRVPTLYKMHEMFRVSVVDGCVACSQTGNLIRYQRAKCKEFARWHFLQLGGHYPYLMVTFPSFLN